ncbi:DUF4832 domain-containing protein [Tumebacillus flagellatus]|uniref:DUF4832 domain-containing protein n=1 Tax=Tumebacillus flagellatus TaxID=1157490 RepID=A0A074LXV6_9BACL|nr:DUF4832 domain-containing protein [Tumebacillus flagellatus]KEO85275.1 hypothetical protein EL26_01575 [Tumebacillus flagellatus]
MIRKTILLTAALLLTVDLTGTTPISGMEQPMVVHVHKQETQAVLNNPFMGLAPGADHDGPYVQPHRLVYGVVTWKELEPVKGQFNFAGVEKRLHFDEWNARGAKVILRVVLDYSSDTKHIDIPEWLYQEMHGDGAYYDADLGKGFSPNYSNPILIQEHAQLMKKLGERYDHDPRIAFLALGSLGHWGEWHTLQTDTQYIPFPKTEISDLYVHQYLDAFPDKKLLMRRPYPIVGEYGIGLYNDMFGNARSTYDFKDWYENGYRSSLAEADIPAVPEFWKEGPSGGEFGDADTVKGLVKSDKIESVLQQARDTHVSWMGASILADEKFPPAEQANLDRFLNTMGYRFTIPNASFSEQVRQGGLLSVALTIANRGVAPFYYKWPLELSLVDTAGHVAAATITGQDITRWLPGENDVQEFLPVPETLEPGTYTLCVAILDPDTKKPGIDFAMDGRRADGRYELGQVVVTKRPPLRLLF